MRFDPKQWKGAQPYPPLATIGAAALLRENGFRVSLFDTMFTEEADAVLAPLEKEKPDFFVIYDDGFNYLTKMCLTNMREAAFRMIAHARQRGSVVIVSSSDSTDHYRQYLEMGADFVVLGEGEQSLLELTSAYRAGQTDFSGIEGLAWMQDGKVIRSAARKVMKDLDALPLPAWDLVDIEQYRSVWMKAHGYFSLNISTTRGCPFKCNWCAKPIYGNRYHARSPRHVVKELQLLKERYGFDHIWMCDDIFGLKPGWVHEFADLVEAAGLQFGFKIQSRADLLLQENYVRDLARAGCENSWMGAESGSQKILDAMDKGTKVEQIEEATVLLRRYRIKPSFFIQFGYPGETKEDIEMTVRMINRLLPDSIGISVSYPLPGTVFYERVKAELKEKTNWTDSDELKFMFKNTYQPAYYRRLHRYVHKSYHWHMALQQMRLLLCGKTKWDVKGIRKAASMLWYWPAAAMDKLRLRRLAGEEQGNDGRGPDDPPRQGKPAAGEASTGDHVPQPALEAGPDLNDQQAAAAFSRQSTGFDAYDATNTIIHYKRHRVRSHVLRYMPAEGNILELNAGTGTDALYFASQGYKVHATDIAEGMIGRMKEKVKLQGMEDRMTIEKCSFNELAGLRQKGPYDLIFSNFAGLNCARDLDQVLQSMEPLIKPGGQITLVILPAFSLWETAMVFKGKFRTAFRRLLHTKKGTDSRVEGVSFKCWYYSPKYVMRALGDSFTVLGLEGLCTLVPPSYIEHFAEKHPKVYRTLQKLEDKWKGKWPWRTIGDYYILSLRKK